MPLRPLLVFAALATLACGGGPSDPPFTSLDGAPVVSPDGKVTVTPNTTWLPGGVPVSDIGERRPAAVTLNLHVSDPERSIPSLAGADGTADTTGEVTRTVISKTVGTDLAQDEALRLSRTAPRARFLPDGRSVEVSWDGAWERVELQVAGAIVEGTETEGATLDGVPAASSVGAGAATEGGAASAGAK